MYRLSELERNRAKQRMLVAGATVVDVIRTCNYSRNTIHELIRRFRLTDNVHELPRSDKEPASLMIVQLP